MALVGLVVAANPRLYERNVITIFFLSCAWVLQEIQSVAVVRSLVLALLQGEASHRASLSFDLPSSNIFWITLFAIFQDNLVGIARLVAALALVSFSFHAVWNRTLTDGIQARSQSEYWSTIQDADVEARSQQPNEAGIRSSHIHAVESRRSDFGTLLQLVVTRRAYDMLSRRSRSSTELEEAKRQFIASGGTERGPRDRFTMAVFSAISKQGTATVIRSAESSQVGRYATRAAAFVEHKFTVTALNRVEAIFRPLPIVDPAQQSALKTFVLLLMILAAHKKAFQYLKREIWEGKPPIILFLIKQTSRSFFVLYISVRYALGFLRRADPLSSSMVVPSPQLLGAVRTPQRQTNEMMMQQQSSSIPFSPNPNT